MEKFINQMQTQAKFNNIVLNDKQLKLFYQYMQELLEWNKKINLTSITEQEDIILKHFIDCMTILPYISEQKKIIDIGSGAGFPGIPIKIMVEDTEILFIDSLRKRIQFLEHVINQLHLKKAKAIHARAEELGRDKAKREKYDVATSRAVAKLNVLVEYLLPFVKIGGTCICMKANHIEEELKEAQNAINSLGGQLREVKTTRLGNSDIVRNIIIIEKIKETPKKFPRKPGTPTSKPIL